MANDAVPKDFKDATVFYLYKRKGDRSICDKHRSTSLQSTAGKIMAQIILNRLAKHVSDNVLPETRRGFRSGRETTDMMFTARQLQGNSREHHRDLYIAFVNLTKAIHSDNRNLIWRLLSRIGCPCNLVNIIRSFHDNMPAIVSLTVEILPSHLQSQMVVKPAPLLFTIFFSVMLHVAFRNFAIKTFTFKRAMMGTSFNLRRFNAKTEVSDILIHELLFADDCAVVAHTIEDIQFIMDCFSNTARRFGLTVSLKKSEVLYQPKRGSSYTHPVVRVYDTPLRSVDKF